MNVNGIVSTQPYRYPTIGCDLPQNGGISGNLGKHDKPIPGVLEERPTMTDPRTGEKIYVDEWLKQQAIKNGAVFSTTA